MAYVGLVLGSKIRKIKVVSLFYTLNSCKSIKWSAVPVTAAFAFCHGSGKWGSHPKAVNNLCIYIWEMFTKVPAWAFLGLAQASHGLTQASQGLAWDPLDMAPACQRPRFGLHRPGYSLPLPKLGPLATQFPAWGFHGLAWTWLMLPRA